ncbi:YegS/Rv2252/BmrU family lipid kinase [Halohasta litchfieldiae]|jgi:YegS/Rv2252/BmrU family lipid kinase|uniref:Lipid kinase, YegS/Rv2252/BmrU family n=1 Tax=Halohasta litchfieldiae TaxID=1073996 RepID=A0A1H6XHD9_9EURY|nr:diacylglycerol kinase family protein [Halohasta litchfieldiae]ATW87288.1 YegS/Rv2252/BmrU family lipid kinase [Halohasta litchfieldiae]SEJ24005.1 lipid kinase, YegS/Rv2252/BmrU family [Halohasta litchfieldiae]
MEPATTVDSVVVCNPESGTGDYLSTVRQQAAEHGYRVRKTERAGHAVDLAGEAVDAGATFIAAAGGDGTLNEVVRGIEAVGALDSVTVGVIPCGTGNNFARNIGITGIHQAFETFESGERRWVDLAFADGRPFVNSCVGGLTAEASAETSADLKRRFGTTAYVISTLRTVRSFESIRVSVEMYDDPHVAPVWSGDAVGVLIGNGRRFPPSGSEQANMEDGRFDVTLVRATGSVGLLRTVAAERLFNQHTPWTSRYTVSAVDISVADDQPVAFSLDGEIIRRTQLSLRLQPKTLRIAVGDGYEPAPT